MSKVVNSLKRLDWDSQFLDYGVGLLIAECLDATQLNQQLEVARSTDTRLIYLVTTPIDAVSNMAAQQVGGKLMDRKVTYGMGVAGENEQLVINSAIKSVTEWTPRLEHLALQSGEYSRFKLDPQLGADVFRRLYQQWLVNSLSHEIAREVLAYDKDGQHGEAIALMTLGVKGGRADIGLLAVDEHARGQRLGQEMVAAAKQRAAMWGMTELQVVTQLDNQPACRFYQRCGFTQWQVEHIYHLWL